MQKEKNVENYYVNKNISIKTIIYEPAKKKHQIPSRNMIHIQNIYSHGLGVKNALEFIEKNKYKPPIKQKKEQEKINNKKHLKLLI